MANDRATLSAVILARLATSASLHGNTYEYQPGELTHFPTAVVVSEGHDEVIADNGRDLRLYKFAIQVYVERGKQGFGTAKGERIRRELEDEILTLFDNYQDLGGNALWMRIQSGGWGYAADPGVSYFTLNLTAYKAVNISSS